MLHRNNAAVPPTVEDERLASARLKEAHVRDLENRITGATAHLDTVIALVRVRS